MPDEERRTEDYVPGFLRVSADVVLQVAQITKVKREGTSLHIRLADGLGHNMPLAELTPEALTVFDAMFAGELVPEAATKDG
jgi:hypothetical protein